MDKKSKILLVILLAILLSAGITFYKIIVLRDFDVINITEDGASSTTSILITSSSTKN